METNEKIENTKQNIKIKNEQKELHVMHYHGDKIRSIFLTMAIVMLLMTPFFKNRLFVPAFASVFAVLALSVLAGLTNPKSRIIIIFNFLISIGALLVFGHEAIASYDSQIKDMFFLLNLVLAGLATFAIYFSSKTLRGNILFTG